MHNGVGCTLCGEELECSHCIPYCECSPTEAICPKCMKNHKCIFVQRKEKLQDKRQVFTSKVANACSSKRNLLVESGCACSYNPNPNNHDTSHCKQCGSGPWCISCLSTHEATCGNWFK